MKFETIKLPTTRIATAKLICDSLQSAWPSGLTTNIKSRGNYHTITMRFGRNRSIFGIKVCNNDIVITYGNEIWNMFTLNREDNTAVTLENGKSTNLIFECVLCALTGQKSRLLKIYDIGEALAELYSMDLMNWYFTIDGNMNGVIMIDAMRLELRFDHMNRFKFDLMNYPVNAGIDSEDEPDDGYEFGDTRWMQDGSYNYMATGFNQCKTWLKLTQDIEKAISLIKD